MRSYLYWLSGMHKSVWINHECFISHNTDTPKYMEALSVKYVNEYFMVMYDEIQILMRRDTCEIVLRKLFSDHNVIPGTQSQSARVNLIVQSVNLRQNIVCEGASRIYCVLIP